jgi:hypothetical protein
MQNRPERRRAWSVWFARPLGLVATIAIAAGCVFDPIAVVQSRASCAGVDPARLRDAVESDQELRIVRTFPSEDGPDFWCQRNATVVHVTVSQSKSVVRVAVTGAPQPPRDELQRWHEAVDYVCARMSAECPEIGSWE